MKKVLILTSVLALPLGAQAVSMPGMCARGIGPDETKVCADPASSEVEGLVYALYKAALEKQQGDSSKQLQENQTKWWDGVKGCAGAEADPKKMSACINKAYAERALFLQKTYKVAEANGPVAFSCADGSKLQATFLKTTPASMVLQSGERSMMLRGEKMASGVQYGTRDTVFKEHKGKTTIKWGVNAKEISCKKS